MSSVTRRSALATGLVLLGGAAGTAVGLQRPLHVAAPPTPPSPLTDAVERERTLIARIDAAIAAGNQDPRLPIIRADHAAHLRVLQAKVQDLTRPTATAPPPSLAPVAPVPVAELRAAEGAAAAEAAVAALRLSGEVAVVLASIAASESTHAELLR